MRKTIFLFHVMLQHVMAQHSSPQSQNSQIRPLPSQLVKNLNKEILVAIKIQNHFIKGILKMFDMHLNLIIDNAIEITKLRNGTTHERQFGTIILRGDSIIFVETSGTCIMVSDEETEKEI